MITNCWTLDHRMLGGLVAGMTSLAHLQNLPRPQRNCYLRPLLFTFTVPDQFRYLVWRQEPGCLGWSTRDRLLTKKQIFSPAYHAVGTTGHAVKCHYFSCFMARFFADQSLVYFCIQNLHINYKHEWNVPIRHLHFSIHVRKCVTSQCGQ